MLDGIDNERIRLLAEQAGLTFIAPIGMLSAYAAKAQEQQYEKFAELIVAECSALNKKQGYNLSGVVIDTEHSSEGFDQVCLNTVKHVEAYLFSNTFEKHFGVEE
jgi:hypothetical protein